MPAQPPVVQIRKYPNRRLYDQTHGRYLTHGGLYDLVAGGATVEVVDSRSGQDITNVVLLQTLLERDPAKLGAFPPALMHQVVRASEQMLQSFTARYFGQVLDAFVTMQRQFESFLSGGGAGARGAAPASPAGAPNPIFDWAMAMMRPPGAAPPPAAGAGAARPAAGDQRDDELADLRSRLDTLTGELERLRPAGPAHGAKKPRTGKKISRKRS